MQDVLLPFMPSKETPLPLSVPETFRELSIGALVQFHLEKRLPSLLGKQPVFVAHETPLVLHFSVII